MKAASRIVKRKLKLTSSELRMLQAYKLDMSLLLEDYTLEFSRDMSFIKRELKLAAGGEEPLQESSGDGDTLDLDSDTIQAWKKTEDGWEKKHGSNDEKKESEHLETSEKPAPPSWAKKLYKKIAMVSHPDKTAEDHRKKKLSKIFRDCAQIMSEGNFDELLGYALELDIDVYSDDDTDHLPLMISRVNDLKREIHEIQQKPEWLWGETLGELGIRTQIAAGILSREGLSVNNDILADIISRLEEQDASPGNDSRSD